jgi:hypothetical protein
MVEAFDMGAMARARGCLPAYYSPAMEAARPRGRRRRPRRGTVDRPVNARLVRVSSLVVAPALLAILFSVSTTGVLPRPTLEPIFDAGVATELATRLATEYPDRVPGSAGAEGATHWFRETIAGLGLGSEEDVWTENLSELGEVELRNVVVVVPGRSEESIVLVAHRDNAGAQRAADDNAAATAALIELARGFAPQEAAPEALFERTLVLVSTDGGAYGGAGARRFARESPYAAAAIAVVVLDGIDRRGEARIAIAADEPSSPARALVRTAVARIEEQTGRRPALPSVPTQLVDLAIPYAAREQGPFLAEGIAAITIGAGDVGDAAATSDLGTPETAERIGELGRASEALVGSIDASVGAAFRTPDSLFLDDRAASGWAIRLALVVAIVPFVLGVVDLLVRTRRRRIPLAGAVRALRTRLVLWLYAAALLWLGAALGVFPTGAPLALPPGSPPVSDWPLAGLTLLGVAALLGWLWARRRLVAAAGVTPDERLAGYSVGLAWVGVVAVVLALTKPYALLFVLPSLYTWLWLPLRSRLWTRIVLYAAGFLGPIAGLAVLCLELRIGPLDGLLYVASLATVGYVSLGAVLVAVAWLATASQLGALALGRYAPYAGGVVPPPPGVVRGAVGRVARYVSAR